MSQTEGTCARVLGQEKSNASALQREQAWQGTGMRREEGMLSEVRSYRTGGSCKNSSTGSIPFALWKEHSGCFSRDESGSRGVKHKAITAA